MADTVDVWPDLVRAVKDRAPEYTNFWEYYRGIQSLPLDPTELNSRFGSVFAQFRDNLALPIIEAAEGRVRIKQIGEDEGVAADANEIWNLNNMAVESKWVHKEAMVKGDSFVIVLPNEDDEPAIWPQISESCAILYSEIDPRKKEAAIKWWVTQLYTDGSKQPKPYVRVNIYHADKIERYISRSSKETLDPDFEQYEVYEEDGVPWETPHEVGQVPMFQFSPNYDITTGRGTSDLEPALGFIDLITKTFLDMAVASEFTAAPQRWATGIEIPLDPKTGEPMQTFRSGADNLWTAANDNAKFGQFQAGSVQAFTSGLDTMVEHLSVVSRTPMYYLMAQQNWPSGEALRSSEASLRQRVQDHQEDFSPVWGQVVQAALALGGIEVDDEDIRDILPKWLPPNAPFATREHLEELKVHAEVLGVPEEMLWRKAGYTQPEIDEMKSMREEEAALGLDLAAEAQAAAIVAGAQGGAETTNGLTSDTIGEPGAEQVPATQPPQ